MPHQPICRHLLIRADASPEIGSGHVMRMIALAQAWQQRGGRITLATQECPSSLQTRWRDEKFSVHQFPPAKTLIEDAAATVELARQLNADCVVLDGYQFNTTFQTEIQAAKVPLLVVDDDRHLKRYHCDLILNQNLGTKELDYANIAGHAKILAGTQFALLRQEFLNYHQKCDTTNARNLLVTLGGSPPTDLIQKILSAVTRTDDINFHIRVLVGATSVDHELIQGMANRLTHVSVLANVSDMAEQYRWAQFAMAAGGSTNWELCWFGLPRIVFVLAENQRGVASALERAETAVNLGDAAEVSVETIAAAMRKLATDSEFRCRQSQRSQQLVDGRGAARVVESLTRLCLQRENRAFVCESLTLRPATNDDSAKLLAWRNNPATRAASRNQRIVSLAEHERWFTESLTSDKRRILIAETNESIRTVIGTVRFDFGDEIEISWTVAPEIREKGWGGKMVQAACCYANCGLIAWVQADNRASRKIAEANGFESGCEENGLVCYRDVVW